MKSRSNRIQTAADRMKSSLKRAPSTPPDVTGADDRIPMRRDRR
jgi:hypothetical protein